MAHIGEEAALGAIGFFGKIARLDQLALVRLAFGDVARHRDDVGAFAVGPGHGTAANLGPDMAAVRALQAHLGAGWAAEIAGVHEHRLHRLLIVGMHQGCGRLADEALRLDAEQRPRGGTGIADTSVGGMARDEVHRVVGEEAIHRGAFARGFVGGALAVLRGGGDQRGLEDRDENRDGKELPGRFRQARSRQHAHRLDRRQSDEREGGRNRCTQHRGPSARQRRFRGHQREPHHQRRQHSARQRGEIADQAREARQRRLLQQRQRHGEEGQEHENSGSDKAEDGKRLGGVGPADDEDEAEREQRAERRLRRLNGNELAADTRRTRFFPVNIHLPADAALLDARDRCPHLLNEL